MKKIVLMIAVCLSAFSSLAWADSSKVLQQRLAKVDSFYAQFSQTVKSADNQIIQQGSGEVWAKRPNLFHWNMQKPDESELISDGSTIWFYNPMIEQVTATNLSDAESDELFLLAMRNDNQSWQQYNVSQKEDTFTLTPKVSDSLDGQKTFVLSVTPNGFIANFSIRDADGQTNNYVFSHQHRGQVEMDKFHFILPKGVTLDDQRQ